MEMEEFRDMLDEVIAEIPEIYFQGLNGGVCLSEETKIHPKSIGSQLKIMGEYIYSSAMGRSIWIYYGSFIAVFGHSSRERIRKELIHTVRHELTHHLEGLAGYKDLEVEDENRISRYLEGK